MHQATKNIVSFASNQTNMASDFNQRQWEAELDMLGLMPGVNSLGAMVAKYAGDTNAPAYNYALGALDAMRIMKSVMF